MKLIIMLSGTLFITPLMTMQPEQSPQHQKIIALTIMNQKNNNTTTFPHAITNQDAAKKSTPIPHYALPHVDVRMNMDMAEQTLCMDWMLVSCKKIVQYICTCTRYHEHDNIHATTE